MENNGQGTLDLEKSFATLFGSSVSGTGEEELIKLASKFSRQLSIRQIRALMYLKDLSLRFEKIDLVKSKRLNFFVENWLEWKQYNHSDMFVSRIIGDISMRKFINDQTLKIDVKK